MLKLALMIIICILFTCAGISIGLNYPKDYWICFYVVGWLMSISILVGGD